MHFVCGIALILLAMGSVSTVLAADTEFDVSVSHGYVDVEDGYTKFKSAKGTLVVDFKGDEASLILHPKTPRARLVYEVSGISSPIVMPVTLSPSDLRILKKIAEASPTELWSINHREVSPDAPGRLQEIQISTNEGAKKRFIQGIDLQFETTRYQETKGETGQRLEPLSHSASLQLSLNSTLSDLALESWKTRSARHQGGDLLWEVKPSIPYLPSQTFAVRRIGATQMAVR